MTLDELFGEYHRLERRMDATSSEKQRQTRDKRRKQKEIEIMAHPDSFDRIRCWIVTITITRDESLRQKLRDILCSYKFEITASSINTIHWWQRIHCSEPESRQLCRLVYDQFAMAIEHGLLHIERLPWNLEMAPEKESQPQ